MCWLACSRPYYQDPRPILSYYGPRAWLFTEIFDEQYTGRAKIWGESAWSEQDWERVPLSGEKRSEGGVTQYRTRPNWASFEACIAAGSRVRVLCSSSKAQENSDLFFQPSRRIGPFLTGDGWVSEVNPPAQITTDRVHTRVLEM